MKFFKRYNTLYLNTSLTLLFGLLTFTFISLALVFHFILSPMANRAADDLGGLMHILSKSWLALPTDKKPAFQQHLREQHHLFITDEPVSVTAVNVSYPFIPRLEKALHHHTGQMISIKQGVNDDLCFWVFIPQAEQLVKIGFLHERLGPHPSKALAGIALTGFLLILITTLLLVRRITHPITTLSKAVRLLRTGKLSTKIPETGSKELILLAKNFNQMTHEIEQLINNRSILFGGISHDLRTPITRMQLALELVENTKNTNLISGMRKDLKEMECLIKQSLEMVQGMNHHKPISIEINPFITEIIANYQRQELTIHWHSSECGSCMIEVNALRRILCNLINNAFRYSDQKSVQLSCEKNDDTLIITLLDQGPGIPEDKLEEVFKPFFRLENSRNKKTGGSGLGLAIVQQLCDVHHWKIQLQTKELGGLEVRLKIPL